MKRICTICAALALAAPAMAVNMDVDTNEVRWQGGIDFNTAGGTAIDFNLGVGRFVADGIEVGGAGGIMDDDFASRWYIGGFGEYNFTLDSLLFPYLGAGLNISGADLKVTGRSENNTALELDLRAGVKYFITDDLALDSLVSWRIASDDLYLDENKLKSTDWRLLFGLRYMFDM